jgi:asparagine synthase (glutamine-hydrolysing)
MRNQLLRDADWAGMAHGVEIRVPLVDVTLLKTLAPAIPTLAPRMGKKALANAPRVSLSAEIFAREKTGFGVPIGAWMNSTAPEAMLVERGRPVESKGLMSRRWSRTVLHSFATVGRA